MRRSAPLLLTLLAACVSVEEAECAADADCVGGGRCVDARCEAPACEPDPSACPETSCAIVESACGPVSCAEACLSRGASCAGELCCEPACQAALCGARSCGQDCTESCSWWELVRPGEVAPSPRAFASLAWDGARLVLFGGSEGDGSGVGSVADTWAFDPAAERWELLDAGAGPPPRAAGSLLRIPGTSALVLYAGIADWQPLGDLWLFDGGTWRQLSPEGTAPAARFGAAVAFDGTGRMIVHGGGNDPGVFDDTWAWDPGVGADGAWVQLGTGPRLRWAGFAAVGSRLVLHGGESDIDVYAGETWSWDGGTWRSLGPGAPDTRFQHAVAPLPGDRGFLLFGGDDEGSGNFGDTWLFLGDDDRWVRLEGDGGPSGRDGATAAFADGHGVFLFGGEPFEVSNDLYRLAIVE